MQRVACSHGEAVVYISGGATSCTPLQVRYSELNGTSKRTCCVDVPTLFAVIPTLFLPPAAALISVAAIIFNTDVPPAKTTFRRPTSPTVSLDEQFWLPTGKSCGVINNWNCRHWWKWWWHWKMESQQCVMNASHKYQGSHFSHRTHQIMKVWPYIIILGLKRK